MPAALVMRMRKIQVLSDERPSNAHMHLDHAEPGVLHHLVRDGASSRGMNTVGRNAGEHDFSER